MHKIIDSLKGISLILADVLNNRNDLLSIHNDIKDVHMTLLEITHAITLVQDKDRAFIESVQRLIDSCEDCGPNTICSSALFNAVSSQLDDLNTLND